MKRMILLVDLVLLNCILPASLNAGVTLVQSFEKTFTSGNNMFGSSVSGAGDVNGDGYDDVIVGAYQYRTFFGRAYLYFGASPVMDGIADVTMTAAETYYYFGSSVSGAGDVNNDGYDDVIVGANGINQVYIYYGGSSVDNDADVIISGAYSLSSVVSKAGDVNGDGYDDVIIGGNSYNSNTGRAIIYHGGSSMDNNPDLLMFGEATDNYFGSSVSGAGDLDGDGYDDVIVGAHGYYSSTGRAYVFLGGSSMDNTADATMTGEATGDQFGYSVSGAPDLDGDGYDDVIVGAHGYYSSTGRAYVFLGGTSLDNTVDVTLTGGASGDYFGGTVSGTADLNGDGHGDVIVSARGYDSSTGRAFIYNGSPSMDNIADVTMTGGATHYHFGYSVSGAGDVNGDGYGDVIVGAHYYNATIGRAYVYYGASPMDNTADVAIDGEATDNRFGACVSGAGDANGDGYDDVIICAYHPNSIINRSYVYYGGSPMDNTADVTMTSEAAWDNFGNSVSGAGDANGDGYDDIIVGAQGYDSNTGRAYIHYGGPTMDNTADVTMTGEAAGNYFGCSVSGAGDVNSDGYDDVIVGASGHDSNTGRAYVYYGGSSMDNVADLTLTGEATINHFGRSVSGSGDVNGDGYDDVVIGANITASNVRYAYVYCGGLSMDAGADFILSCVSTTSTDGISVSGAGDVNGDGYGDVIIGDVGYNTFAGRAYVFYGSPSMDNTADVTMTGEGTYDGVGDSVSGAGDLNNDGYEDLIIGMSCYNHNQGRVCVYCGGPSMDNAAEITLTGEAPDVRFGWSVSDAGDVNHDGTADFIIGSHNFSDNGKVYIYSISSGASPSIVSMNPPQNGLNVSGSTNISVTFDQDMNSGTINAGTFIVHASQTGLRLGTYSYNSLTKTAEFEPAADFSAGEVVSVILTTGIQSAGGDALAAPYEWSFTADVSTGTGTFPAKTEYSTGTGPRSVFCADLDGDGDMDLVVANNASNNVSVMMNNGDGTYAAKTDYPAGNGSYYVVSADFDGDGDMDLSTANENSDNISVLLNNGNGTFAAKTDYPSGNGPLSICSSDLDGDGDMDLAVTNWIDDNSISVFLNNGNGTFAVKTDYPAGNAPQSICSSDLDGDGDMDLVTANIHSYNISVLLNNGNGTFAAKTDYPAGSGAINIGSSDLDGDGDMDLACVNHSDDDASVFLNNGNGTFAAKTDYAVGDGPHAILSSDFDNDGDMDLAAASQNSNTVSVLLNNGNGTFAAKTDYAAGTYSCAAFSSDLDGDGDMDLAVADGTSDKVSILLNYAPHITISSPDGGESWMGESVHDITWISSETSGNVLIEYSTDSGSNWTDIVASTPDDGAYTWTLPNTPSATCLVRVSDTDGSPSDQSDGSFTIRKYYVFDINRTAIPPVIDGQKDGIWEGIGVQVSQNFYNITGTPPDNEDDLTGRFRLMWNDSTLYGLFYTKDDILVDDHANNWEQDGWQIYFDADNSKGGDYDLVNDIQFTINHGYTGTGQIGLNTGGDTGEGGWTFPVDHIQFVNKDTLGGWQLEFSIPLADLKITAAEGTTIGFEAQQNDNDSGNREHVSMWAEEVDEAWRNPSFWGNAVLKDRPVLAKTKMFLEGTYQTGGTMTTNLKTAGSIPLTSPYADGRTAASVPDGVTDWVSLSLRGSSDGQDVTQRSFFLKSDGLVVDTDGSTADLEIPGMADGNYYLVLRHRNHLAVMSALGISLSASPASLYDFSTSLDQVYGTDGNRAKQVESGVYGMYAGDTNATGTVDANDRSAAWNDRNKTGYEGSDCNLSGTVDANDRSTAWNNRNKTTSVP